MIRLTEMELTHMRMEQSMWGSGAMISNMALDLKLGLMEQFTKALTSRVRKMGKEL